jgi:RND family efflux transporter MFP subunit
VLTREFTGTIEGEQQAVIRSKINEAVEKINVAVGRDVGAESVVVTLDKNGPSSSYIQAQSVYQNAEKNINKLKYLFDQGAIAETQYDAAETEYEVAKANFESARRLVELTTPIAGTVTSIDVSPGDFVTIGQQVATVATVDKLRMKLGVTGDEIGYFDVGDRVRIAAENESDTEASGRVIKVARSADPETRSFLVELEIDNSARLLMPGMFARAQIVVETFDDIIAVPRDVILDRNDKYFVFIANGDRSRMTEVQLGAEFIGSAQVLNGLKVGDTIITVGQEYLEDSTLIKLVRFVNAEGEEVEP